jgi:hypothetical protein
VYYNKAEIFVIILTELLYFVIPLTATSSETSASRILAMLPNGYQSMASSFVSFLGQV